jgi:hypothetical protein
MNIDLSSLEMTALRLSTVKSADGRMHHPRHSRLCVADMASRTNAPLRAETGASPVCNISTRTSQTTYEYRLKPRRTSRSLPALSTHEDR